MATSVSSQTPNKIENFLLGSDSLYKKHLYFESRKMAEEAYQLAQKIPINLKGQADALMRMGLSYYGEGSYEEAIQNYEKAIVIRKDALKDPLATARSYTSLSSALLDSEGPVSAYKTAREAEVIYLSNPSRASDSLRAMLYVNMANILEEMDSTELAIAINKKALALFPASQDNIARLKGEYGLAKRLVKIRKFEEAKLHLDTAISLNQNLLEPDSLTLGKSYDLLGVIGLRKAPSDPEQAIEYFKKANEICSRFPQAKVLLAQNYFNLAEAYESNGQLDEAGTAYIHAAEFCDEDQEEPVFKDLIESRIESVESWKDNKFKDQLLFWALISLFVLLLSIAIVYIYNLRKGKINAERMLVKEQELLLKEKENVLLKDQMFQLRHDLVKNFLQNIDLLITANNPEKTGETFQKIKFLTSTVLAQVGYANMAKEPETLRAFAQSMHLQAEISAMMPVLDSTYMDDLPDFRLSKKLRENLVAIVAEAFTNIRKYAFDSNSKIKTASIRFEYNYEEGLILTIEDRGKGFDLSATGKSGLKNLETRAASIDAALDIKSKVGEGTSIKLVIKGGPDAIE